MVKTKILLVAEESTLAAEIRALLEEHGYDVFHATGPGDASEALEIQRFQFVLWNSAPGGALNQTALDAFRAAVPSRDKPALVVIRVDVATAEPLHLAGGETGVDAVIEGRFSSTRLAEIINILVHNRTIPLGPSRQAAIDGNLPVFDRDQFERQMNYDRRLVAEIIQLFVSETNLQIAALESALEAGLDAQVKRLAHTLKG